MAARKLLFLLLLISLVSCERMEYYPDKPVTPNRTIILAHKGGGYFDVGNTLQGCIYGFQKLDGIECDLQRSADNTLWLSHSPHIPACGSFSQSCFPSLSDKKIIEIDSCLGSQVDYTQLEAVFSYMGKNYPDKFITLDVKAWNPCELKRSNIIRQMNAMAWKIIELTEKYKLQHQVMVESETGDFLFCIKQNSNFIETYLTTFGDFELGVSRALKAGFSGISFKLPYGEPIIKKQIDIIHQKGLKIQVWTVNNPAEISELRKIGVDFIQTDNF